MIVEPKKPMYPREEAVKYLEDMRQTTGWEIARWILENERYKAEKKLCEGGVKTLEEMAGLQSVIRSIDRALKEITRSTIE